MSTVRAFFRHLNERPALADLLSCAGLALYAMQLWKFAHSQLSVLDEGLYLYKGWLFASGRYTPFQDYGAWTNQMPLAFLIPGWAQLLFGAGLRTGRMLAILLGLLMLAGLWLTARRLGGAWVAAGCVLVMALNPAAERMYAMAASQGLVACLLVWSLFFSLDSERKNWELFCGGLLAGAAVMVRINLLPLLPFLAIYLFLARGTRPTGWWLAGTLLIFGGLHLLYWPDILEIWAKWLPLPFLRAWFPPANLPTWKPDNPLAFRVASFFLAFRYHFAALAGALAAWVFWPEHGKLSPEKRKIAIFLSFLLITFFMLHAWAALGNEYCVFCFPTYTTFYLSVGLLLVAVTLPGWNINPPAWRAWSGALAFLALLAGMAYSAEGAAEQMLGPLFYKRLLTSSLPFLGHGAQFWQILSNKFRLEYKEIFDGFHAWFPVSLALILGLAVFAGFRLVSGRKHRLPWGLGILCITLLGSALAPLPILAGDYTTYDCAADVIPNYEAAGALLAESIPPGSKIFWAGYSPVSLLYLPDVEIYPAQLHGAYSFRISADDDALLKYGWWNEHLAEKWLSEADFILAEQKNLEKNDWLGRDGRLDAFEPVVSSAPLICGPLPAAAQDTANTGSAMVLYRRK